jgi:hypothetical protein
VCEWTSLRVALRRPALTPSDHIEGAAEVARKQQAFNDDGVIDKDEQKAIDKAHKRQLEQRGRGKSQFKPWRTAKWMVRGMKDRVPLGKDKARERESRVVKGEQEEMEMEKGTWLTRSDCAVRGVGAGESRGARRETHVSVTGLLEGERRPAGVAISWGVHGSGWERYTSRCKGVLMARV